MHPELDAGHAKVVRERVMDFPGQFADHLVALGDLPNRDRVAAALRRLGILDDSERNDVSGVTGILYVSERLDNRIVWYLSCH
jgi:hypothetical protein